MKNGSRACLSIVISFVSGSALASNYCNEYKNTCLEKAERYERGLTADGTYFVLRRDGSGCFSQRQGFLDCDEKPGGKTASGFPWLVSCSITESGRFCTATDSQAAKLAYRENSGWTAGVGHNNFPGSPVRLIKPRRKTEELAANDGWLPSADFTKLYQHLITPRAYVEWVEEQFVQYGPKWNPASTNAQTLQAVFNYLPWAIKNADPALSQRPNSVTLDKADHKEFSILDCYSLTLGGSIPEGVGLLGTPESIVDDQVNSAGVRGVTLKWQSEHALCEARYQPRLERYSVTDSVRLKDFVNEWAQRMREKAAKPTIKSH